MGFWIFDNQDLPFFGNQAGNDNRQSIAVAESHIDRFIQQISRTSEILGTHLHNDDVGFKGLDANLSFAE